MTGPFLYDAKRTLTSKTVMVAVAAMVLLSLAVLPDFSAGAAPGASGGNTSQLFVYYNSGGYHFVGFAWNQFGQPLSGTRFDVNVTVPNLSPNVASGSDVSDSSGEAEFTVAVPDNYTYSVSATATAPDLTVATSGTITPFSSATPPGASVPLLSDLPQEVFAVVTDGGNGTARDILVSWAGPDGTPPVGYKVYYKFVFPQCQTSGNGGTSCVGQPQQPLGQTNAKLLGTMSSYVQVFHVPQSETNFTVTTGVLIGLVAPNGTNVVAITPGDSARSDPNALIPVSSLYPSDSLTSAQGSQIATASFASIFGLFIPLLAIVGTYNTYGKDRVTGILESVLAQPVTRRGLSLSRYLSTFAAMSAAIVVSVAIVDLIAQSFTHSFVSPSIVISSTGALVVELAAFIGIAMLLSHLVKSSGTLIGLSVALFLVIDFFQGLIVTIAATILQISRGSVAYYRISVALDFLNPAQFISLVETYFTNVVRFVGIISTPSFSITPQDYGITAPAIVLTGALWISIPLVCFLYLAIRRD